MPAVLHLVRTPDEVTELARLYRAYVASLARGNEEAKRRITIARQLGVILAELPTAQGRRDPDAGPSKAEALAELGIKKQRASEFESLTILTEKDLRTYFSKCIARDDEISMVGALALAAAKRRTEYDDSIPRISGRSGPCSASSPAAVLAGDAQWCMVNDDCLSVMSKLPRKGISHVITDPPYGLGFRGNEWDKAVPDWLPGARRLSRSVIFPTAPTTLWDYPRPDWVVCWSRPASNARTAQGGFNCWTPILVYGDTKFPVDVVTLHAMGNQAPAGIQHPSPKPLALLLWLLKHATEPGDIILDPFAGSGTTGLAALRLGRRFLGIERAPRYAREAVARLSAEERRP